MDRYSIVFALTNSGTLYAAVPQLDAAYRIRRYRPYGPPADRDLTFEGSLASVSCIDRKAPPIPEAIVHCAGETFQMLSDTFGAPRLTARMVAGRKDGHYEVSSSVRWTGTMHIDREWAIEAIFRAYRNEDPDWRGLIEEQRFEVGFEGVRDDSSGLTASLHSRFYEGWLALKAAQRDSFGRKHRPGDIAPRSIAVSNEDLDRELRAAVGDDFEEVPVGEGEVTARIRIAGSPRRTYSMRPLVVPTEHRKAVADALDRHASILVNRLTQLGTVREAQPLRNAA